MAFKYLETAHCQANLQHFVGKDHEVVGSYQNVLLVLTPEFGLDYHPVDYVRDYMSYAAKRVADGIESCNQCSGQINQCPMRRNRIE